MSSSNNDRRNADRAGDAMISRRDFITRATAIGVSLRSATSLAAMLGFPLSVEAATQLAMTFFVFAGGTQSVLPKRVATDYKKAHPNVDFEFYESSNAVTYPKMKAAKQADPTKPLVQFGYFNTPITYQGDEDDMWESIDERRVPNIKDILPRFRRPKDAGAVFCVSPVGILYHKEKVKTVPTSWTDIWLNPEYKGHVVGFDYLWSYNGALQAVLLNGGDLAKPQAGFKVLSDHADQFLTLVSSTQQAINLFQRGDAWICIFSKGIQTQMVKAGAPVGFAIPKEGMLAIPLFLQIVKGIRPDQRAVAEEIINELLSPARVLEYCVNEGYAPVSTKVKLPDSMASDAAFDQGLLGKSMAVDWGKLAKMESEYRELWDRMVKAKL
jgi:putative spermidine/putrescine transport system substrate-binding protein